MNIFPKTVNSFTSMSSPQITGRASLSDPDYEHLDIPDDEDDVGVFEDIGTGVVAGLEGFGRSMVGLADMTLGGMFDMDEEFYTKRHFDRPTGIAGGLAEGITQFAAGLIPGGFAVGLLSKAGRAATAIRFGEKTTKTIKGITTGALADFAAFDGHEARLSDLLAEHTDVLSGVTEYLKSNQDDSEFEGRMKNVIEGGAIGGAVGSLVWTGAKLIKAMKTFDGSKKSVDKLNQARDDHNASLRKNAGETEEGQKLADEVTEEQQNLDPNNLIPGAKTEGKEGTTELPDDFENVSGEQAIYASERLTEAILGANTKAEMDDIFKSFTPDLVAKDAASKEKRAAEMIQILETSGMSAEGIKKAIRGGILDDDTKLLAMKQARAGQQISIIGMRTAVDRLTTIGAKREKELAKSAPDQLELRKLTLLATAEQRRLKYFTATQAAYGTEFSKGLLDRKNKFVVSLQESLGIRSSDQKLDERYTREMADVIADDDDLADAMAEINIQDTDKAAEDLLSEADEFIDPTKGQPTKDKQKSISKKRLKAKESLTRRKESLEKQLELKRKRAAELSGKDPDEIKGEAKAPEIEEDGDAFKLKAEIRSLEEKISYHDQAYRDEQDIITLREEEYYVDTLSPNEYKARVTAKEAAKNRAAKAKGTSSTTVKNLKKIVKSKADRKIKIAKAKETLDSLRADLLQKGKTTKGQLDPSTFKVDPEMDDILARIDSAKKMIREENDIQKVIEDVQALSKLTDQQFTDLSNAQAARRKVLNTTPTTRLQELRRQRSEYVNRRKDAINGAGRGFTTKKAFDNWLKTRPGDMEKGFDTFMKRMMYAADGESPLDAFVKINEMSQMSGFDKFTNFGVRLFQRNLLSGPATTTLNVSMPLAVRLLTKMERIVGAGVGAIKGDEAQQQVFKEALKFHQQAEDFKMVIKAGAKGTRTKSDVVTGANSPFTDASSKPNIDAFDPELYGVNKDSTFGKAMGWVNTWFNLPFALNAGGDSMNKAAAGLSNLRERLTNHVHTDKNWVNKPIEAKDAWVKQTMDKAFLEDGAMYSESRIHSVLAKQARENVLKSEQAGQVIDNPMLIPNELRKLTLENRDSFIRDQDALKLIEETRQFTREVTFTDPNQGEFVSLVNRAREKFPPLTLILPFVNTPAQILSFGLKRTPFGYGYEKIAPLLSKKAAERRAGMAAMSPMQKAEYQGRMATATAGSAALLYYAYLNKDKITGSGPRNPDEIKALRATGWQPNSFVIGDEDNPTYVSYQRLDPFATMIGIAADIADHMTMNPKLEPGSSESLMALSFSMAENITDKSFLRGLNNVLNAVQQPEIYGPKIGRDIVSGMAVPMSVNQFKDLGESEVMIRESRSVVDAVLRKLPIAAEKIPPKRTFLGEAIYKQNPVGLLGVMNPVYVSSKKNDSVDKTIQELVYGFSMPSTNFIGNRETDMREFYNAAGDQAYDRFLELTGTTKIKGRTLRESLKGLVNSRKFKAFTKSVNDAGGQSQLIDKDPRVTEMNKVLSAYRRKAKREMSLEFPELIQAVKDINTKKKQLNKAAAEELNNPIPTL